MLLRTNCALACRTAVTAVYLFPLQRLACAGPHLQNGGQSLLQAQCLGPAARSGGALWPSLKWSTWSRTCSAFTAILTCYLHLYTTLAFGLQERRKQQDLHRRVEKVQRVVNASPEIALAGRLQRLLGAADVHVHEVEQSCIMTQWMLQEVADIGISGLRWSPAKVGGAVRLLEP